MGLEGTDLWHTIEQIAREEGVQLFDLELPSDTRRGGALRVFISKGNVGQEPQVVAALAQVKGEDSSELPQRNGVSFEDCVRVSKRILDLDEQREIIPGTCTLEVSSPGINRKLRLPEHFLGAVGERIKVKFKSAQSEATLVVYGIIRQATADAMQVESEGKEGLVSVGFLEIKEARVDFIHSKG